MLDKMMEGFSDDDFRRMMLRSLRLMAIVTVVAALLLWWKMGWQTRCCCWRLGRRFRGRGCGSGCG